MSDTAPKNTIDFRRLGRTIKKVRNELGLSREQTAEKVGISVAYLTAIENKGQCPSFKRLIPLVKLLGLSLDEFIYADDRENKFVMSPVRCQLDEMIDSMSEKELYILKAGLMVFMTADAKKEIPE